MSRGLSYSKKQTHLILENLIAETLAIRIEKLARYLIIIIIFIITSALCNCCVVYATACDNLHIYLASQSHSVTQARFTLYQ